MYPKHLIAVFLLAVLVLAAVPAAAEACPMCKAALANKDGGGDLVSGFFYSILFMLSMPFAILGVFSGLMYREVRRARKLRENAPSDARPQSQGTKTL
jgi:hypothetical protein